MTPETLWARLRRSGWVRFPDGPPRYRADGTPRLHAEDLPTYAEAVEAQEQRYQDALELERNAGHQDTTP